jgi:beta-galactosidase
MTVVQVTETDFTLDGEPFRIISGALHYFRVHPDNWADRLRKARLMGLNAIDTYVPWNRHQPRPDEWHADGWLDLPRFLDLAHAEGLRVLFRPGPYICAEFDGGGLPAWLYAEPGLRPRTSNPRYLSYVDDYFDILLPLVMPRLATNGGPIIAVQVENEYGAFGADPDYLAHLAKGLIARGVDVPLFTADQADEQMLAAGALPGVWQTVNFGSRATSALDTLRRRQPSGPLMCAEFWNGWFDRWGGPHTVRSAADAASTLDEVLAAGASVNFYMFHGGTNFGFGNGANDNHGYEPTVTSYDYDSPLDEAGDPTEKYAAFRAVIAKYAPVPDEPVPARAPKLAVPGVELGESAALFGVDIEGRESADPLTMEELGQTVGFAHYRVNLPAVPAGLLWFSGIGDRAQVFHNGRPVGVLERERREQALWLTEVGDGDRLDVLVENQGRVNYGQAGVTDRKGLLGPVSFAGQPLTGWTCRPFPLDDVSGIGFSSRNTDKAGPTFYRGRFEVTEPSDTFLRLDGWTKGVAWVNGFNLGRYWSRGPQHTLYLPGPLLRTGDNELVVLELHGARQAVADLVDRPDLGPTGN